MDAGKTIGTLNLDFIFPQLRSFRKILVTGPQRSGTTIAAQVIAAETSLRYVDERDYGYRDLNAFRSLLESEEPVVIQCPNFAHIIEQFTGQDTCIVFMHRDPREIITSQRRVAWKSALYQRNLYRGKVPYVMHLLTPVCVLKYLHWHLHQKQLVEHHYDIAYQSLSNHPHWVEAPQRTMFTAKQTS